MSSDVLEFQGIVLDVARGGVAFVKIAALSRTVIARAAGRLVKARIKVIPGDEVTVEVSPYDLSRGRITYRGRKEERAT